MNYSDRPTNTREDWLNKIYLLYKQDHPDFDYKSNIRFSCGRTSKKAYIGECWHTTNSEDGTFEIFITPLISDSVKVASVLIHEVCHTIAGFDAKHGAVFKQIAIKLGLEGKMTATHPSEYLTQWISKQINKIGLYPHASMIMASQDKKQSTRLLKAVCPNCEYTIRLSKIWAERGLPICPNDGAVFELS